MDAQLLRAAIVDNLDKGRKIKAIIVVHIYGIPANIKEIQKIAQEFEIPIIEDAAESFGSKYAGVQTGTFGEMGILSFNGNKIITTSGGGALISDNEEYISKARFFSTQAKDNFPFYHHTNIGYNYRMSNVVAGIGRGQLEVIEDRILRRRQIFDFYKSFLSEFEGIDFAKEAAACYSNRWLTCITISPDKFNNITNHKVIQYLEENQIETRYVWKPMHLQPIFAQYPAYTNGVSEDIFNKGLCLPSGSGMTDDDLYRIKETLKKLLTN
jgi:dTDP-4-amino-4,6-dideoxygalactose transaminase